MPQLDERTKLLRPVSRHSSTNGKNPKPLLPQQGGCKVFEILERVKAQFVSACSLSHAIGKGDVQAQLRIRKSRHEYRHALLKRRFQYAALPFGIPGQVFPDSVVEFVRAKYFAGVPTLQYLKHHFLYVVQIPLRLQGVVDAVVTLLVEFDVRNFRVVTKMGAPGGFHQPMRHEGAGRDNCIDNATIAQLCDDKALLRHGHGSRQGHPHETVFVSGHSFQHVDGFAELAAGKRSLGHRSQQVIDRVYFFEIERLQWNQLVLNRIVKMALRTRAVMIIRFQVAPPVAKHYFTRSPQAIATATRTGNGELKTGNCYPEFGSLREISYIAATKIPGRTDSDVCHARSRQESATRHRQGPSGRRARRANRLPA